MKRIALVLASLVITAASQADETKHIVFKSLWGSDTYGGWYFTFDTEMTVYDGKIFEIDIKKVDIIRWDNEYRHSEYLGKGDGPASKNTWEVIVDDDNKVKFIRTLEGNTKTNFWLVNYEFDENNNLVHWEGESQGHGCPCKWTRQK